MAWNALAVFVGLLVGSAANLALMWISGTIWPLPPGADPIDPGAFAAHVATLPAAAFAFAMVAHLTQAGIGGAVAAGLGRSHRVALALIVGAFTLVGSVVNLVILPSPAWMWVEVALVPLVAWWAGAAVVRYASNAPEVA